MPKSNKRQNRNATKTKAGKGSSTRRGSQKQRTDDHKMSQVLGQDSPSVVPAADDEFRAKPLHFRLLEAYRQVLEEKGCPTDAVIAQRLDVRRETVCRWRRRHPPLWQWVRDQIGEAAAKAKACVDFRVSALAQSGSPEHIKLFYQFVAKVAPEDEAPAATVAPIINLLIPRPDMPTFPAQSTVALPAIPANVPRVNVR